MRITGGFLKSRKISGSPGNHVRPTTDQARESLFNILSNKIVFEDIKVLDLFSGTGIVSLEFLSRGTTQMHTVEINSKSIQFIQSFKRDFGLTELDWQIIKMDVLSFLKNQTSNNVYDLIFADPPYSWDKYEEIISLGIELLSPNGIMIVEHDSKKILVSENLQATRIYGQSSFSFFSKIM
jgi:16S rRNA (guanine966-N2)-methyltransferase